MKTKTTICIKCKHHFINKLMYLKGLRLTLPAKYHACKESEELNPVTGEKIYEDCSLLNKGNCKKFKEK